MTKKDYDKWVDEMFDILKAQLDDKKNDDKKN